MGKAGSKLIAAVSEMVEVELERRRGAMECELVTVGVDGWSEWIHPTPGFRFQCCDCGLVHDMDFQIVPPRRPTEFSPGEGKRRVVIFRARRSRPDTPTNDAMDAEILAEAIRERLQAVLTEARELEGQLLALAAQEAR